MSGVKSRSSKEDWAFMVRFGGLLKARMTECGMNQTKLAKKVGLTQAQVSRLLAGVQGLRWFTMLRLFKALDVPRGRLESALTGLFKS